MSEPADSLNALLDERERRIATLEARLARVLDEAEQWREMAFRECRTHYGKIKIGGRVWSSSRAKPWGR